MPRMPGDRESRSRGQGHLYHGSNTVQPPVTQLDSRCQDGRAEAKRAGNTCWTWSARPGAQRQPDLDRALEPGPCLPAVPTPLLHQAWGIQVTCLPPVLPTGSVSLPLHSSGPCPPSEPIALAAVGDPSLELQSQGRTLAVMDPSLPHPGANRSHLGDGGTEKI